MTTSLDHPLGVTDLPVGLVPCWSCGLACPGPASHEYRIFGRVHTGALGTTVQDVNGSVTELFGCCDDCQRLVDTAHALVSEHPALRHRYGSLSLLANRMVTALVAYRALDKPVPEFMTITEAVSAIDRLSGPGVLLTWAHRWSPVRQADALPNTCASEPFLFAPLAARDEARAQMAECLIDSMNPRPFRHPENAGCLACGVDRVDARRMSEAWFSVTGKRTGYVCAACAPHVEDNMISQPMLERAVLQFLDPDKRLRGRRYIQPEASGLVAWIDTGRKPSAERFAHLNLDALRESLETGSFLTLG